MGFVIMSGVGSEVTVPITGTPLSAFAEGSLIKINESNSPVEFYVAKHNYEQELNGAGRTLVVRKDCYNQRSWHNANINVYASSDIDSWLNGDYKNLLDTRIRKAIGTTKFYYTIGNGNKTISKLERAVFLLSAAEIGTPSNYVWLNMEGSALGIAGMLQTAYLNGVSVDQWNRSPDITDNTRAAVRNERGGVSSAACDGSSGCRPCFTLPSGIGVNDDGLVVA